jgi:hypothetical protein
MLSVALSDASMCRTEVSSPSSTALFIAGHSATLIMKPMRVSGGDCGHNSLFLYHAVMRSGGLLLAKAPWIVPIPGTTRFERLEENLRAVEVVLSPEDVQALDNAPSKIKLEGARYPKFPEQLVGR